MSKRSYEVEVILHEQINRSRRVKVQVEALTPSQAAFMAEGEVVRMATAHQVEGEWSEWSEPSCHYEAKMQKTKLL